MIDSTQSAPAAIHRAGARLRILALAAALSVCATGIQAAGPDDSREVYGGASPHWLQAVGKLQVPGSKIVAGRRTHHREDCSATLVAKRGSTEANTIVTAWHCLEFYADLSRPITFTLFPGSHKSIEIEAHRLADGGGIHSDWALLRLRRAIAASEATAMSFHPERADPALPITMAGYSRDAGKGDKGNALTFDANCTITAQATLSSDSDCMAYKGASGGAVMQFSKQGAPLLSGVISRGDSSAISIYVPVTGFRSSITRFLQ